MEKYSNRRQVRRVGGRFAKPLTLEQQGYDINPGGLVCQVCGKPNLSLLRTELCWECRQNQATPVAQEQPNS